MKANETTFQHVIEGTKQYIVPLFQRPYCWDKSQWETLWNDLVEMQDVARPRSPTSSARSSRSRPSRCPKASRRFLLIDGQQRLTTTFILLTLLRDTARREGRAELAEEIEQTLLVNRFKKGDDHVKLLPTQADRPAFLQLVQEPGRSRRAASVPPIRSWSEAPDRGDRHRSLEGNHRRTARGREHHARLG